MIDLETVMKKIEESEIEKRTTKELKEYGLNDYYIKKAIQEGRLEKTGRGKYKITKVTIKKIKKAAAYFKQFTQNISNKNFSKAYDNLYNSMINQVNHNYDNNLVLYFILLKEILGNKKDFSFLDNLDNLLLVGERTQNTKGYYQNYIDFSEAVLSHDFEKAYYSILKIKDAEKERKKSNNISTLVFSILTEKVMTEIEKRKKQEEQNEKEINDKKNYNTYYNNFYKNIKEDNYEEALENLYKLLPYYQLNMKQQIINYIKIIKTYLEIRENKQPLPVIEKHTNYSMLRNSRKILDIAIEKGDFETALQIIERNIEHNPNKEILILYRTLLQKLIDQDKQNKEELKEDKIEETPKIEEQPKIEVTPKKEPEIPNYTINELIQLIYDREYEKVQTFLIEYLKNKDNRTYSFALKLIKKMNNIYNSGILFEKEIPNYLNSQNDPFKRFFEALKYSDYEEALEMVTICEKIAENPEEFTIYRYIIEDLLATINLVKEKNTINTKIGDFVYNKNLTEDNIKQLEKLIKEKLKLLYSEEEIICNSYYSEMMDILKSIKEDHLTANDFEHFTYDEENIEEKFFKALNQGDYKEALNIMNSEEWFKKTENNPNKKYFPLYRKLLTNIKNQLNKNEQLQTQKSDSEKEIEEDNQIITQLENLKKLIKKRKFKEAYFYYQCNNLEGISENLDQELQVFLPFLDKIATKEEELINLYRKANKKGDFDKAEQYLEQLEEWIKLNGSYRNIDYFKAHLNSQRKEIETDDFVIKEQLYDAAKYYLDEGNYQQSINLLNQYIERDQDLSEKGYLLRGRNYEHLKKFEEAIKDYQKAISITPKATAYHRLGKVHLYKGEVEKALEYFLEYENRRPKIYKQNLQALSDTYKLLGNEELSEKYKQMIKSHSENRK